MNGTMASHEGDGALGWFHVYCWMSASSVEAEVFARVKATDTMSALQAAMRAHRLSQVAYAWVVPQDDALDCYEASSVCVS